METKLFRDEDTVTSKRPMELSEERKEALYKKLAEEIIEDNWSDSNVEDIINDLKQFYVYDTGFEMAKDLETNGYAQYEFNGEFISWLDDFRYRFRSELDNLILEWVKLRNIQPKFKLETQLKFKEKNSGFLEGDIIFINGYDIHGERNMACYCVSKIKNNNENRLINYEILEEVCEIIN